MDLAGPHDERRVAKRRDGAVVLDDARGFEKEIAGHRLRRS
jgi:hypothetical protein